MLKKFYSIYPFKCPFILGVKYKPKWESHTLSIIITLQKRNSNLIWLKYVMGGVFCTKTYN